MTHPVFFRDPSFLGSVSRVLIIGGERFELLVHAVSIGVFISFFVFASIAVFYGGRARQAFVVYLVCGLLVASLVGIAVTPFTHAHRFTHVAEQVEEVEYIWMVDSSGEEIQLDERVALPVRDRHLATELAYKADDETRIETAALLIDDSEEHRDHVKNDPVRFSHPPPSVSFYWDEPTLKEYDEFEAVRVYQVETTYEQGGHEVEDVERTCLVEIVPESSDVVEGCGDV